jgi:ATP-binding cassette subfamily B protein RaxB
LRINAIPITECDLSSLRQHIRIVHADDILFTGSILDNIACFDSAPDKEQVIAACRLAEIDHVVARLPHGYETEMLPGNTFFCRGDAASGAGARPVQPAEAAAVR